MKIQQFILPLVLTLTLATSCNSGQNKDNNTNGNVAQPVDPNAVETTPAYSPSVEETEESITIKGNCVLFYYPTDEELSSIKNGAADKKIFLERAEEAKKKYEAKGLKVYVSNKESIKIHVSDTRSAVFNRAERSAKFGVVLYNFDNAPFYLDGVRTNTDIEFFTDRYFFKKEN